MLEIQITGSDVVVLDAGVTYWVTPGQTLGQYQIQLFGSVPIDAGVQPFQSLRIARRANGSWETGPLRVGDQICNNRQPYDFEHPSPWFFGDPSSLRPAYDAILQAEAQIPAVLDMVVVRPDAQSAFGVLRSYQVPTAHTPTTDISRAPAVRVLYYGGDFDDYEDLVLIGPYPALSDAQMAAQSLGQVPGADSLYRFVPQEVGGRMLDPAAFVGLADTEQLAIALA